MKIWGWGANSLYLLLFAGLLTTPAVGVQPENLLLALLVADRLGGARAGAAHEAAHGAAAPLLATAAAADAVAAGGALLGVHHPVGGVPHRLRRHAGRQALTAAAANAAVGIQHSINQSHKHTADMEDVQDLDHCCILARRHTQGDLVVVRLLSIDKKNLEDDDDGVCNLLNVAYLLIIIAAIGPRL